MSFTPPVPIEPVALRTTLLLLAAGLSAAASIVPGANAATSRSSFTVGATVLAHSTITAAAVPITLEVSADDVARGFVAGAAQLTIANTSPEGFALEVTPLVPVFSAVEVRGTGAAVTLDADGGTIVARGARGPSIVLDLDFRFALAPGVAAGRYSWPLAFGVRPLAQAQ